MMFRQVIQLGSCFCHRLQLWLPSSTLQVTRGVHHNDTFVFERLWDVMPPRKHSQPRLKRRNSVLIKQHPQPMERNMKCILTEEVKGLGYKGSIVEVDRRLFRNQLFPTGKAVYASPENLAENDEYLQSEEAQKYKGIDFTAKSLMEKISGLHLRIPMNCETEWELNKTHIRVACRHMGLILKDNNIILPEEPVTQPGEVVFGITLDDRLKTKVRGTVYLAADNQPLNPDTKFKELWDNPPVNKDSPIELVQLTKETEKITSQDQT